MTCTRISTCVYCLLMCACGRVPPIVCGPLPPASAMPLHHMPSSHPLADWSALLAAPVPACAGLIHSSLHTHPLINTTDPTCCHSWSWATLGWRCGRSTPSPSSMTPQAPTPSSHQTSGCWAVQAACTEHTPSECITHARPANAIGCGCLQPGLSTPSCVLWHKCGSKRVVGLMGWVS